MARRLGGYNGAFNLISAGIRENWDDPHWFTLRFVILKLDQLLERGSLALFFIL